MAAPESPAATECQARALSRLLGYFASDENRVVTVSKSHPVFSAIGLQRSIISYLAHGERGVELVVGAEGSGKSSLLRLLEARAREVFPLLTVHSSFRCQGVSGRGRAARFLREIVAAHDEGGEEVAALSQAELLHGGPALLARVGARAGGLLLIVDDLGDSLDPQQAGAAPSCWLPAPLPPGVHCVASAASTARVPPALLRPAVPPVRLVPLAAPEQRLLLERRHRGDAAAALAALAALVGEGGRAPRAVLLVARLVELEPGRWREAMEEAAAELPGPAEVGSQASLALAILRHCGRRHGRGAVAVFALLAVASHGLTLEDLRALRPRMSAANAADGAVLEEQLLEAAAPLLRVEGAAYFLGGDFALRACQAFCGAALVEEGRRLLAAHVLELVRRGPGAGLAVEAAADLLGDGDAEPLADLLEEFAVTPEVLRHFAARPDELVRLWRRAPGGCSGIGARLLREAPAAGAAEALLAGRLLSMAGAFAPARDVLRVALEKARRPEGGGFEEEEPGEAEGRCAETLVVTAMNEVRYWDSRRDWGTVDALRLLGDSTEEAVRLARRRQGVAGDGRGPPPAAMLLARALSRRANYCFKAGCVCEPGGDVQTEYFDEADRCVSEAVELMAGAEAMIVGEAVLVGGVTTLCRAHSLVRRDLAREAHREGLRAMAQFYHAEAILRRSVGPANEKSIFTFGNLSELFWQDFREFYLGFLHRRQSCIVAVRVFGPEHANTVRTLRELQHLLQAQGWADFEAIVRSGRPELLSPAALAQRFEDVGAPLRGFFAPRIAQELRAMAGPAVRDGFWARIWADLGVPEQLLRGLELPT